MTAAMFSWNHLITARHSDRADNQLTMKDIR